MNHADLQAVHDARVQRIKDGEEQRAYSVIQIKSIDDDERVLTGIATTPTPDSVDDIVEPLGAEYKLPLPFLKGHRSDQPIGEVTRAKVSKDGIEVRVEIAKTTADDPPALKERLDVAWAEIKKGLIRGLSIGFTPIEYSEIKGTFGLRYTKWSWRELSAVVIPANADAQIETVKALDREQLRAASGLNAAAGNAGRASSSPGASGSKSSSLLKGKNQMKQSIVEQLKAAEASLTAAAEKRNGLMQKAADENRTLDGNEAKEYDEAKADIERFKEHIERLKEMEKDAISGGTTVDKGAGVEEQKGSDTRAGGNTQKGGAILFQRQNVDKGIAFTRFAQALMMANGNPAHAMMIAESRKNWQTQTPQVLQCLKTAVAAGTTTASAWADDLVYNQNLVGDFIEYLRPQTIVGQIANLRRVPFNVRVGSITSGGSAAWVGQGAAIPLSKLQTDATTLAMTKIAGLMAITKELAMSSDPAAETLIRDDLTAAIAQFMDQRFIDPSWAAVANVSPASVTNGVTPVTPSGVTLAAFRTDIQSLFAGFIANSLSTNGGVWVMTQTTALSLSLMTDSLGQRPFDLRDITPSGGTFLGYPVIVSQVSNVAGSPTIGNLIVFLLPNEIMFAEGGLEIDASDQASLEMSDAPANNSATPTAAQMVSMFQTRSVAIRAIRDVNWAKRRTGVVQFIQNALYAA
jgi:HK97 family phage major capsid protein/HK97 family phage prohead protease